MFLHQLLFIPLMIKFPKISNAYSPNCPDHSQKKLREIIYCKNVSAPYYSCLCDSSQKYTSEFCKSHLEYAPPGQKYIYSRGLRNVKCSKDRFQPFVLWENVSEACLFRKYACNEEGQIIFENGSGEKDRTCSCDYTNNYSFIIQPKNKCFCIPWEEDCSCYIKECLDDGISGSCNLTDQSALALICPIHNRTERKLYDHEIRRLEINVTHDNATDVQAQTKIVLISVLTVCLVIIFTVTVGICVHKYEMSSCEKSSLSMNSDSKIELTSYDVMSISDFSMYEDKIDEILDRVIMPDQERTVAFRNTEHVPFATKNELSSSIRSQSTYSDDSLIIIIPKYSKEVEAGQSVTLPCFIKKGKTMKLLSVQWIFKKDTGDEIILNTNSFEYVGSTLKQPSLFIESVTPDHAGEYKCRATYNLGEKTSDPIRLSVTIPKPVVKIPTTAQDGVIGNTVILKCIIDSPYSSVQTVEWIHTIGNTEKIIDTKHDSQTYSGGTVKEPSLIIKDVSFNHSGTYVCQVTNKVGTTGSNPTEVCIKGKTPEIHMKDEIISGNPRDSIQIKCYVQSHTKLKSIKWLQANGDKWNSVDVENSNNKYSSKRCGDNLTLTIHNLNPKDRGQYRCLVDNDNGCATSKSVTVQVEIEAPFVKMISKSAFKVVDENTKNVVILSYIVSSSCALETSVEWLLRRRKQCDNVINVSAFPEKYLMKRKQGIELLKIKNPSSADTGKYKCRVSNTIGTTISKSYKVAVVRPSPPLIIAGFNRLMLGDDRKTHLIFLVISAHQPISVIVEKSRNGVQKQICFVEVINTNYPYLKIYNLETHEPGSYICHATSAVKTVSSRKITVYASSDFSENIKMVAALDIGSSYSKYAFSTIESLSDSIKFHRNYKQCLEAKTCEPTCILLTENGGYFGNDAINIYEDNIVFSKQTQDSFVLGIKPSLLEEMIMLDKSVIEDVRGRKLPTTDVFTAVIKSLTEKVMIGVKRMDNDIHFQQVLWILTTSSTSNCIKEFWITCGEKAGIPKDKLMIIENTTAAITYAMNAPLRTITDSLPIALNRTSILLVDIGGLTCQISAIKKLDEDEIITSRHLCVNHLGGNILVEAILDLIKQIVGSKVLESLQKEEVVSYYNMRRNIESALKDFSGTTEFIKFTVPFNVLDKLCKRFINVSLSEAVDDFKKGDEITLKEEKMYVNKRLLESSNKQFEMNIISKINDFLFQLKPAPDVPHLLLVGGLSNSLIVQNAFKNLPNMTVIITDDANFAVATGAMLYGCKPNILTTRVAQYWYGTFDESGMDEHEAFQILVKKGEYVPVGHKITKMYNTIYPKQAILAISIFMSRSEIPAGVDDAGCKRICDFDINVPNPSNDRRFVDVEIEFGNRDLIVTTVERKSREQTSQRFSLM